MFLCDTKLHISAGASQIIKAPGWDVAVHTLRWRSILRHAVFRRVTGEKHTKHTLTGFILLPEPLFCVFSRGNYRKDIFIKPDFMFPTVTLEPRTAQTIKSEWNKGIWNRWKRYIILTRHLEIKQAAIWFKPPVHSCCTDRTYWLFNINEGIVFPHVWRWKLTLRAAFIHKELKYHVIMTFLHHLITEMTVNMRIRFPNMCCYWALICLTGSNPQFSCSFKVSCSFTSHESTKIRLMWY